MPLGDIPMPKVPIPEVHFHGKTEIILGRDWRSEYVEEEESLPDDRPALFGYACVVRGDYGYVTEPDEDGDGWRVVEGEIGEGESPEEFVARVNSSAVLVNASTRFNDGGELGLGAEIGISTSKIHAFGPMGLEELTSTKFFVFGDGQVRT